MGASPENVAARGGRAKRADGSRIAPGEESSGTRVYRRINRPAIPKPGAADRQNKDNDERLRRQEREQFSKTTNRKQSVDDQEKAQKAKQLATKYTERPDAPKTQPGRRGRTPNIGETPKGPGTGMYTQPGMPGRSTVSPADKQREQDRKQEKAQVQALQQENPGQQYSSR